MKLSNDQKRIIKSIALYTVIFIVVYPLMTLVAGRQWTWADFFILAGIAILVFGMVGGIFVLGSKIPRKDE